MAFFKSFLFLTLASTVLGDLIVSTKNGDIKGREHITVGQSKLFYSFRGIPFAQPPVGELRFEAPVPVQNWVGVWDATEERAHCIQTQGEVVGNEDCLFLNVYTPEKPSDSCQLRPTMVWIYGGGFKAGTSLYEHYGPDYLLDEDVVVVTINYRLGVLGFISTGDTVIPGNNGLKDQNLALQWVRDNIDSFCGDPNQITLAGQSAGSASVAYHIQSPASRGLFQRAILQSGVSLSLWAYSRRSAEVAFQIGESLGIDYSNSTALKAGLKQIPAYELQQNASSVAGSVIISGNPTEGLFVFAPVSEVEHPGAFFSGKSYEILERGDVAKVPILIGFNSLEGTFGLSTIFRLFLVQFDLDNSKMLPIDLNIDSSKVKEAAKKLKQFYFGWLPVSMSSTNLMKFISDDQFNRAIREFAKLMSKQSEVFLYRFSYEGGLWGIHNRTQPGVTHSEELGYYWRTEHPPKTEHDFVIRERMVKLWTNFIKNANPTPTTKDRVLQDKIWPTFDDDESFMEIGEDLVLSHRPEKKEMDFWDDMYAQYGNKPYDTY